VGELFEGAEAPLKAKRGGIMVAAVIMPMYNLTSQF